MPPPSMDSIRKGRSAGQGRSCRRCWSVPSEQRGGMYVTRFPVLLTMTGTYGDFPVGVRVIQSSLAGCTLRLPLVRDEPLLKEVKP